MNYSVISQLECGGYRCEQQEDDFSHAVRVTRQRAAETQRRHFLIDRRGRVIKVVHPQG